MIIEIDEKRLQALLTEAVFTGDGYGTPAKRVAVQTAKTIEPMLAEDLAQSYREMREDPTFHARLREVWFNALSGAIKKKATSLVSSMKQTDLLGVMGVK